MIQILVPSISEIFELHDKQNIPFLVESVMEDKKKYDEEEVA